MTDDHATFLRKWAADIRNGSGRSVDADRLDEIAAALSALPAGVRPLTAIERKYLPLAKQFVSGRSLNYPYPDDDTTRIVGFRVPADVAGLSEALFALDAVRAVIANTALYAIYPAGVETLAPSPPPQTNLRVWTQKDAEREYVAFAEWFKERGYPGYPDLYPLTTENAMHSAWQEAAKRASLSTLPVNPTQEGKDNG